MVGADPSFSVIEAIYGRRSIRRFLLESIPDEVVYEILEIAARAPSGQNMQPWLVHVVTGETRERLSREVTAAATAGKRSDEYPYFPTEVREPYLARRRKVGFDLFALYGVERSDMAGRQRAMLRNFDFFGAPVGLFFTMRRDWGLGAWIDMGAIMMNVMAVARAFGLETCPQQAWCEYGQPVRQILGVADDHVVVSGMALGRADYDAIENTLITERISPADFVTRHT